jgi:small-conductance mechanosensitive channel
MFEGSREALIQIREALSFAPDWVVALIILGLAGTLALGLHGLGMRLLHRLLRNRPYSNPVLTAIEGPTRLALMVFGFGIALPTAPLAPGAGEFLVRLLLLTVIGLIGWSVVAALHTAANLYLMRFRIDTDDNLLARKHLTQVRILLRTAEVLVFIITVGAALMTFEPVRQYGVSLFASAGVAGLVVGLAARPVLTNLLAGVQLAITQPIRIDDVVIVEGEYGWVEEINATYVVVKLWDWRRMIVPLTYFIEKPFQNWTHEGSQLIGSVKLYLDYSAPVDRIREKAKEFAEKSSLWNGTVFNVQVIDATADTIQVRILVSANSAAASSDLCSEIREKVIGFLVRDYPHALPRHRQESYSMDHLVRGDDAASKAATRRDGRSPPLSSVRAEPG